MYRKPSNSKFVTDVWKIGIYLEFQFHLVSKEKKKMDYIEKL